MKDLLATIRFAITSEKEREYFFIHEVRYRFLLLKILQATLPAGSAVLDIGCYPLHIFTALEKSGFTMFGVSSKHESVRRSNIVRKNIETDVLPFPDARFDAVIFSEILEHLLIDPRIYLRQIRRVLKPGGRLFITTPNVVNLKNRLRLALGKNIYFSLSQLYDTSKKLENIYYRHNREYTQHEVVEVLKASDFDVKEVTCFDSYTPFRTKVSSVPLEVRMVKIIGYFLTFLHDSLKDTIYIEARRPE